MEKFKKITSVITPFDKAKVDTDQIVPKQYLKLVQKVGFGKYLFYNWRFESDGTPKKDFILNKSEYIDSKMSDGVNISLAILTDNLRSSFFMYTI